MEGKTIREALLQAGFSENNLTILERLFTLFSTSNPSVPSNLDVMLTPEIGDATSSFLQVPEDSPYFNLTRQIQSALILEAQPRTTSVQVSEAQQLETLLRLFDSASINLYDLNPSLRELDIDLEFFDPGTLPQEIQSQIFAWLEVFGYIEDAALNKTTLLLDVEDYLLKRKKGQDVSTHPIDQLMRIIRTAFYYQYLQARVKDSIVESLEDTQFGADPRRLEGYATEVSEDIVGTAVRKERELGSAGSLEERISLAVNSSLGEALGAANLKSEDPNFFQRLLDAWIERRRDATSVLQDSGSIPAAIALGAIVGERSKKGELSQEVFEQELTKAAGDPEKLQALYKKYESVLGEQFGGGGSVLDELVALQRKGGLGHAGAGAFLPARALSLQNQWRNLDLAGMMSAAREKYYGTKDFFDGRTGRIFPGLVDGAAHGLIQAGTAIALANSKVYPRALSYVGQHFSVSPTVGSPDSFAGVSIAGPAGRLSSGFRAVPSSRAEVAKLLKSVGALSAGSQFLSKMGHGVNNYLPFVTIERNLARHRELLAVPSAVSDSQMRAMLAAAAERRGGAEFARVRDMIAGKPKAVAPNLGYPVRMLSGGSIPRAYARAISRSQERVPAAIRKQQAVMAAAMAQAANAQRMRAIGKGTASANALRAAQRGPGGGLVGFLGNVWNVPKAVANIAGNTAKRALSVFNISANAAVTVAEAGNVGRVALRMANIASAGGFNVTQIQNIVNELQTLASSPSMLASYGLRLEDVKAAARTLVGHYKQYVEGLRTSRIATAVSNFTGAFKGLIDGTRSLVWAGRPAYAMAGYFSTASSVSNLLGRKQAAEVFGLYARFMGYIGTARDFVERPGETTKALVGKFLGEKAKEYAGEFLKWFGRGIGKFWRRTLAPALVRTARRVGPALVRGTGKAVGWTGRQMVAIGRRLATWGARVGTRIGITGTASAVTTSSAATGGAFFAGGTLSILGWVVIIIIVLVFCLCCIVVLIEEGLFAGIGVTSNMTASGIAAYEEEHILVQKEILTDSSGEFSYRWTSPDDGIVNGVDYHLEVAYDGAAEAAVLIMSIEDELTGLIDPSTAVETVAVTDGLSVSSDPTNPTVYEISGYTAGPYYSGQDFTLNFDFSVDFTAGLDQLVGVQSGAQKLCNTITVVTASGVGEERSSSSRVCINPAGGIEHELICPFVSEGGGLGCTQGPYCGFSHSESNAMDVVTTGGARLKIVSPVEGEIIYREDDRHCPGEPSKIDGDAIKIEGAEDGITYSFFHLELTTNSPREGAVVNAGEFVGYWWNPFPNDEEARGEMVSACWTGAHVHSGILGFPAGMFINEMYNSSEFNCEIPECACPD